MNNIGIIIGILIVLSFFQSCGSINQNNKTIQEIDRYEEMMSIIHEHKAFIKSGDSINALLVMKKGIDKFAYRKDFIDLFNNTLNIFIKTTNLMLSDPKIECIDIQNRVTFLLGISPDSFERIENNRTDCEIYKKQYIVNQNDLFNMSKIFNKIDEIKYNKNLLKEFQDLQKINNYFDGEDLLSFMIKNMGNIHLTGKEINWEIEENVNIRFEYKTQKEKFDSVKYCDLLEEKLTIKNSKNSITCKKFGWFGGETKINIGNQALKDINKKYPNLMPRKIYFKLLFINNFGVEQGISYYTTRFNEPAMWEVFFNEIDFNKIFSVSKEMIGTKELIFKTEDKKNNMELIWDVVNKEIVIKNIKDKYIDNLKSIKLIFDPLTTYQNN